MILSGGATRPRRELVRGFVRLQQPGPALPTVYQAVTDLGYLDVRTLLNSGNITLHLAGC